MSQPGPFFLARHIPWTHCGCEPRVSMDEETYGMTKIAYCPLHAAAPEMLTELRAMLAWVEAETDGRDWPHERLEAARALLAKIEGK